MNRLIARAVNSGEITEQLLRAKTQKNSQRIKKNILEKFKEASHEKLPRKMSEHKIQVEHDYIPMINNFSYLRKGDGMGKNFLLGNTMKSIGKSSEPDTLEVLYRTFNSQLEYSQSPSMN